jgi:polyisoprenoid-binding protein YceI
MRLLGTLLVACSLAAVAIVSLGIAGGGAAGQFGAGLGQIIGSGGSAGTPVPSADQATPTLGTASGSGTARFAPGIWVVTNGSSAGYAITETTVLGTATVTGRTTTVSGQAKLGQTVAAITLSGSTFSADLTKLSSGDPFGDGQVASALQTAQYPNARFEQTAPVQLPSATALQRGATVTVAGRVTLRGKVRQVSVPAQVTLSGGRLIVAGSIPFRLADFGIDMSAFGGLVTLGDTASLNLSLVMAHQ